MAEVPESGGAAGARQALLHVEVVYALPGLQRLVALVLAPGSTVRAAVMRSGIPDEFPQLDLERTPVGIFGRVTGLDAVLCEGDRVEIYRPLPADPKAVRRRRAARGGGPDRKRGGEGGGESGS